MGGEIGAFHAPSLPDQDDGLVPLLPGGTSVFDDLPLKAIVVRPLAPAIGDGLIVVRNNGNGTGLFLVRDGEVVETHCVEAAGRLSGEQASRRIKSWKAATVSARRLTPAVVAVVPPLILGDPAFSDLRLDWIKWSGLLADVRSQAGTYVIEVITPSGRGVTCIRDGEELVTYTAAHPEPGDRSLIDEVAAVGTGTVRVLRDPDSEGSKLVEPVAQAGPVERAPEAETADDPAPEMTQVEPASDMTQLEPPTDQLSAVEESARTADDANGQVELHGTPYEYPPAPYLVELDTATTDPPDGKVMVSAVLPELKLLVRDRLHRSSMKLEILLEEAATWDRSVESIVDDVRNTSIRGVRQTTLEEIAEQMLAVGGGYRSGV